MSKEEEIFQTIADCIAEAAEDEGFAEFHELALYFEFDEEGQLFLALDKIDADHEETEIELEKHAQEIASALVELRESTTREDKSQWVGGMFTLNGEFEMNLSLDWGEDDDQDDGADDEDFDEEEFDEDIGEAEDQ